MEMDWRGIFRFLTGDSRAISIGKTILVLRFDLEFIFLNNNSLIV
jgi:hypothetical protein